MQSTTLGISKACIVPLCHGRKFQLVHKFPSDQERFAEWIEVIQKHQKIKQFEGLSDEQIRKRYFICCRHFGINQYKNVESRSLNITATPHLNLANLDEIQVSKAWETEDRSENTAKVQEIVTPFKPSPVKQQVVRILNTEVVSKNGEKKKVLKVLKRSALVKPQINSNDLQISMDSEEPESKKPKIIDDSLISLPKTIDTEFEDVLAQEQTDKVRHLQEAEEIQPVVEAVKTDNSVKSHKRRSPALKKTPPKRKETPKAKKTQQKQIISPKSPEEPGKREEEATSPVNKLLALIEVTPEQYENLSKTLTSAERSDQISTILNFIDKKDTEPETADNEISVEINEETYKFDLFWLRDHCRCEKCYDHSNHQRKINILDIPDDIKAEKFDVGEKLKVIWNDEHESSYDLDFLIKNQPGTASKPSQIINWNSEIISEPLLATCRVSMRDYMTDPAVSKKVLESLHVYGVAFIDGVQPTERNTEFVIRELFPVHKTLFGEMWTFSDAKDHSDTAYTNIYLGPHNDNTYFNDAAGLQILHCIQHYGSGGENFLIDGFQVALRIKEKHPEVFERLTTTNVTAEYIEDGKHHSHSAPIISLDAITGDISQIRFNLYDRAPLKNIAAGKIREFYADLKVLAREFENVENRITFKLQPGTVMIFDNWRVLHGRLAYTGKRTMTGCYVARTEYRSALRVNRFIE